MTAPLLRLLAAFTMIATLATGPADAGQPIIEHDFAPADADPAVRHADALDVAAMQADGGGKLLLFIGGGRSLAAHPSSPFLDRALAHSYRVLALDYVYDPPGTSLCEPAAPPCFPAYRSAKVFGTAGPAGLVVPPAEAVLQRLVASLHWLAARFPQEGWQRYLAGDTPRWDLIAVTGFSQGAGLAAFLAKRVSVDRVILLSSPWDHYDRSGRPAEWLGWPSATPTERWWGLHTSHESQAAWLEEAYDRLGVAPSHRRVLDLPPRRGAAAPGAPEWHWSLTGQHYTPRTASGGWAYATAWDLVLGDGTAR